MMSNVKAGIKKAMFDEKRSIENVLIENKLNQLFRVPKGEAEVRRGLHASAIIVAETAFCKREQVLSLLFERNKDENISDGLLRIFEEGNYIHAKWQDMFARAKIARSIEGRGYSKTFDLYMTPDAIIELNNKMYVVEIKSANTYSYKSMKSTHPGGTKQLQLYMHFLCIPQGFVLVEDKNTQEFKTFITTYEPGQAKPFVKRLHDIREAKQIYLNDNILPKQICPSRGCKRAQRCPMSDACWGINRKRLK